MKELINVFKYVQQVIMVTKASATNINAQVIHQQSLLRTYQIYVFRNVLQTVMEMFQHENV